MRGTTRARRWNIADEDFPGAVQTVGLYHAREHVSERAKVLYRSGTPKAKVWAEVRISELDAGDVEALVGSLTRLRPGTATGMDETRKAVADLESNAHRMRHAGGAEPVPRSRRPHRTGGGQAREGARGPRPAEE